MILISVFICIIIIYYYCVLDDDTMDLNEIWGKIVKFNKVMLPILALIVATYGVVVATQELGHMKESLELQVEESKKTSRLLNDTLSEKRAEDFDEHTEGIIYVWDYRPLNKNKSIWVENLTILFSNNFDYYALKDVNITITLPDGCNRSNISTSPQLGASFLNRSLEYSIKWNTIGVDVNATATHRITWSRSIINQTNITPLETHISAEVRGEIQDRDNFPIRYAKPPDV